MASRRCIWYGVYFSTSFRKGRTGTDQAHGAVQYVEKLGQLVQACLSQESADGCDTGIFLHLKDRTVSLVLRAQLFQFLLCVYAHGAEFIHGEEPSVLCDTYLLEDRIVEVLQKTTRAISSIGTLSTATAQNDRITSMARLANKYFFRYILQLNGFGFFFYAAPFHSLRMSSSCSR